MSFGTAVKAFFSILFSKETAQTWQQASKGELVSNTQKDNEVKQARLAVEDKVTERLNKEFSEKSDKELSKLRKDLEAEIAKLTKKLALNEADTSDAIYTLVLLQREGRFIDFIKEDISAFADDQIGAAVRQIHQGCAKVLQEYFKVEAISTGVEGDAVEVPVAFDINEYTLTGQVSGEAPYKGELRHKGWKVVETNLPTRQQKEALSVIAPAEVEI